MCEKTDKCQRPGELGEGEPAQCSPEQIERCHGKAEEHPCVKSSDE